MSRSGVFISYDRRDQAWFHELRVHLTFLERHYDFFIWDDSKVDPGLDWRKAMHNAIHSAKVAVLLVSPHYLSSDVIYQETLPKLLRAADKDGAKILPVVVSHCMFRESMIADFQPVNSPDRPLTAMDKDEWGALFVKLSRRILEIMPPVSPKQPTAAEHLRLSLAQSLVLLILYRNDGAEPVLTVSDIHKSAGIKNRRFVFQSLNEMEKLGFAEKKKVTNRTRWKLTQKGKKMGSDFDRALQFTLGKDGEE